VNGQKVPYHRSPIAAALALLLSGMCGIAGLFDPTWASLDPTWIANMTSALAPRGPDGEGFWRAPGVALGEVPRPALAAQALRNLAHVDEGLGAGRVHVFGLGHEGCVRAGTCRLGQIAVEIARVARQILLGSKLRGIGAPWPT
jgi:hypothetical protein